MENQELEKIYKVHYDKLFRKLVRIHPNRADCEDVLQNTFIKAFMKQAQYDPTKASMLTWVNRLLVTELWDFLRKKKKQPKFQDASLTNLLDEHDESFVLDLKEVINLVENPTHRVVLTAKLVLGMTYNEIAFVYGVTKDQSKKILQSFKKGL